MLWRGHLIILVRLPEIERRRAGGKGEPAIALPLRAVSTIFTI